MLDATFCDVSFSQFLQSHNYSPEDLAKMRRAFRTAYAERPQSFETDAQRLAYAKAIVLSFNPLFTEDQLLTAAWGVVE
jgi:hypothetical protein